ncbi:phosphotransferase family protein [Streptomyces sp. NPDC091272]|uniref:phosphotransferase family protein n=1 Tax=Streptomyces sp. NPDC091272 TaxID=3365981 RepID=UPI0038024768
MKFDLHEDEVRAAVAHSLGTDARVTRIEALEGGTFNSAYRITLTGTGERTVVLKVSPPPGTPLMTYEYGIMRTEAQYYTRLEAVPDVPAPRLIAADFDRVVIDSDYLLMTHLEGTPWNVLRPGIDARDRARLRADLGGTIGRLHCLRGDGFGYPQRGTPATGAGWRTAFEGMVRDVCADARRYRVALPVDTGHVLGLVSRWGALLDEVTVPTLVHFDLWDGNVLLTERNGRPEISGLIDGERAFWGDPLADLVAPALFDDIARDPAFLARYRSLTGGPDRLTRDEHRRIALYRIYLALIVLIEATPRGYVPADRAALDERARADLFTAMALLRQRRRGGGLPAAGPPPGATAVDSPGDGRSVPPVNHEGGASL